MRFLDKSLRIFKYLCDNATQSIRHLAQQTGLAKSSVHRLTQTMERRGRHPESWWWETEEGRGWFTRLVVATLYTFGLKRGVGVETLSAFFARLRLDTQVGCSPCALRQVMQAVVATAVKTAETWEQDATAAGEVREIIGGVDETFLERMMLVFGEHVRRAMVMEDITEAPAHESSIPPFVDMLPSVRIIPLGLHGDAPLRLTGVAAGGTVRRGVRRTRVRGMPGALASSTRAPHAFRSASGRASRAAGRRAL